MKSKIKTFGCFLLLLTYLIPMGYAGNSPGDDYKLKRSVLDMGGSSSVSADFRLIDAVGQGSVIGGASSEDYYSALGFFSQGVYKEPTSAPKISPSGTSPQIAGQEFWIEIVVGSSSNPVSNLFALRFYLLYTHTEFIDVVSPYEENIVLGDLFGDNGSLSATVYDNEGKIAISIVGSAQQLVSGYGVALKVKFTSSPDTPDGTTVTFSISDLQAMDAQRNAIALEIGSLSVSLMAQTPVTQDDASSKIPVQYKLYQNYPNPFNPTTTIRFDLPEPAKVKLLIYNMNGELVRMLLNDEKNAGSYLVNWNGRDNKGHIVGSGVYFYHLESRPLNLKEESFIAAKKLIFLK